MNKYLLLSSTTAKDQRKDGCVFLEAVAHFPEISHVYGIGTENVNTEWYMSHSESF